MNTNIIILADLLHHHDLCRVKSVQCNTDLIIDQNTYDEIDILNDFVIGRTDGLGHTHAGARTHPSGVVL